MDSMLLAQIFGLYFLVAGVAMILRGKELRKAIESFAKDTLTVYSIGAATFLLGLLLVLNHNVWDGAAYQTVITIIAWIVLLEGLIYMWLPKKAVVKLANRFNARWWCLLGTVLILVIGVYLTSIGFNF